MTKIFPNASLLSGETNEEAILTVWRKSLLFNCNGFTVFDSKGELVFRVDNYMDGNKGQILLMDATGKPLLTIRRKKMSLGDSWLIYEGETLVNPLLCVRKPMKIRNNKCLATVVPGNTSSDQSSNISYEIEGSYSQRSCGVYDDQRRIVAEIKKKESVNRAIAYGTDIFRLVVQRDHISTDFAMALVILLDQMFGPSRR